MIPVGFSELRKGFLQNKNLAEMGSSSTHYLLLFYAVECGLKSIYLKRQPHSAHTTANLTDDSLKKSHDLGKWVKELRLPRSKITTQLSFRLTRDIKKNLSHNYSLGEAHQVWRYGIEMNPHDEKQLAEWLHNVKNWIGENI